jgi:hypothetical protein
MEHVPTAMTVTVAPEAVQTVRVVEAKLTGSPELAEALTVKGAIPRFTLLSGLNVIVCEAWDTVKLRITLDAAL